MDHCLNWFGYCRVKHLWHIYEINIGKSKIQLTGLDSEEIPDDINIHKKIWGKNADEVVYGGKKEREEGKKDKDKSEQDDRCLFCDSRIDEF
ncbi:MAG TPA: hypothetical protein VFY68_11145, partial [Nitrososphaeraceae archaeon]|nr:hypothetical protein [Nitrososphaeraceae archaeon]